MNSTVTPVDASASVLPVAIARYFETFNAENFAATASLFAASGALRPPFDAQLVGREAIASYLEAEAKGMELHPLQFTSTDLEDGNTEYIVAGRARTPFFTVNISWLFILNPQSEIAFTKVKLLASLVELLNFKNISEGAEKV